MIKYYDEITKHLFSKFLMTWVSDRHTVLNGYNNKWAIKIFKKLVLWLYIIPNMLFFVTNDNRMQS